MPTCSAHFLVNFSWFGVHTNSFPGLKAVMTSFQTRLLVKENLSIFPRTHEQIKLVKENLSRKNCSSVRGLTYILGANRFLTMSFLFGVVLEIAAEIVLQKS